MVRVLVIDDDQDNVQLITALLQQVAGGDYLVESVCQAEPAVAALKSYNYDICLLDYYLSGYTGLQLMANLDSDDDLCPVIMMTASADADLDQAALEAGMADFLPKQDMTALLLERSIRYAIRHAQATRKLAQLAHYDELTGVANRSLFFDRLQHAIEVTRRNRSNLALLYIDIDRFKFINDSLGHQSGDALLKEFSARLQELVRSSDTVSRLGGDEFAVLLEGADNIGAHHAAQKILRAMEEPFHVLSQPITVSSSIGLAMFPEAGDTAESLVSHADEALYIAKSEGRDTYRKYIPEMNGVSARRAQIETEVRKAVERGELELYYQPQINVAEKRVVGTEALMRWRHPSLGMVSPAEFIPVTEQMGLMPEFGRWCLETAVAQLASWRRLFPDIMMSVNISPTQCQNQFFVDLVRSVIDRYQIPPQNLELELTESVVLDKPEVIIDLFNQIHEHGVHIALDDFGTGYSSLSYLSQLPVDTLKIDLSFLRGVPGDARCVKVIRSIISLGQSLDLRVIAEGAETFDHIQFLRGRGCNEVQGFVLAKPMPAAECERFLIEAPWRSML